MHACMENATMKIFALRLQAQHARSVVDHLNRAALKLLPSQECPELSYWKHGNPFRQKPENG